MKPFTVTWTLFASPPDASNNGWVWLALPPATKPRSIIKITNHQAHKSVYCEGLAIEDNFRTRYNRKGSRRRPILQRNIHIDHTGRVIPAEQCQNPMVINFWYRNKLGSK